MDSRMGSLRMQNSKCNGTQQHQELQQELKSGKGKKFQMFDDDGIRYYSGRIIGDYQGFEPLDDYGTPNAGCTDIKYFENGKWESL